MLKRAINVARVAWDLTLRFCAKYADSGRYVAAGSLCGGARACRISASRVPASVFPGCNQRRWTDAHHIHHWADERMDYSTAVERLPAGPYCNDAANCR